MCDLETINFETFEAKFFYVTRGQIYQVLTYIMFDLLSFFNLFYVFECKNLLYVSFVVISSSNIGLDEG